MSNKPSLSDKVREQIQKSNEDSSNRKLELGDYVNSSELKYSKIREAKSFVELTCCECGEKIQHGDKAYGCRGRGTTFRYFWHKRCHDRKKIDSCSVNGEHKHFRFLLRVVE